MTGRLLPLAALLASACTVFDQRLPECTTNSYCTTKLGQPSLCVQQPTGHCVALMSEDCTVLTGDPSDDNAVVIASLLSTTGAQASTNLPRQQSAIMAVEEINESNASGGILESSAPGDTKKLVMLSCDEIANLPRVATHLIDELKLPAIVGPNLSQDTIDLTVGDTTRGLPSSAQAGTLVITPVAVANAIASLPDNGLTWQMVPTDVSRVPLMKQQINEIETTLAMTRARPIKLGIFYRNDALGKGTSDALSTLTLNGESLSSQIQKGNARVDAYPETLAADSDLVTPYRDFAPDIVVVVGTAEAVNFFMKPLEAAWNQPARLPYYVAIDSTKVPDLITLVTGNDALRMRIRGTGVAVPAESKPVFSAFQFQYGQRWKDAMGNPQPATISNMGPTYDAVFAVALALVGQKTVTGANIATGLRRLATNTDACAYDASMFIQPPCFTISDYSRTLYQNMTSVLQGNPVTEIGTFGRFEWDANGAKSTGLVEMWCIDATGPKPVFASSGLTYDIKTGMAAGTYTQCGP